MFGIDRASQNRYEVVFSGSPMEGVSEASARAAAASSGTLDAPVLGALRFDGRPVVVFKSGSKSEALRIRDGLRCSGLACKLRKRRDSEPRGPRGWNPDGSPLALVAPTLIALTLIYILFFS